MADDLQRVVTAAYHISRPHSRMNGVGNTTLYLLLTSSGSEREGPRPRAPRWADAAARLCMLRRGLRVGTKRV